MSGELNRRSAELAALAAGLCQDAGIRVEVGSGWSWDPVRRVIQVSATAVQGRGPQYCAGIVAHEVGHYFISRYLSFRVDFPSQRGAGSLLNAIEDPRVDRWIVARYPGAGPWQEHAKIDELDLPEGGASLPSFVRFCLECAAEGDRDFRPTSRPAPAAVVEALEATRDARRRYAHTVPPTDPNLPVERAVTRRYLEDVRPKLTQSRWIPVRSEQRIQLSASDALDLAAREVLPAAAELYLSDRHRIACWLCDNASSRPSWRERVSRGEAAQIVADAIQRPHCARPVPSWAQEAAGQLLDDMADARVQPPRVMGAAAPRTMPPPDRIVPELPPLRLPLPPPTDYERARGAVSDQIDQLVAHLEEVLRPRRRSWARAGYASGRRVDLRRLMSFEADPRRYDELWIRTTIPDRREVAVGLLVDLSGSMHGGKAEHAVLGAVLLAETLHRLDVPFAIDGFQDVLIPLHEFDEPMSDATRGRIAQIPQEVSGARAGGNNQPAYNDDGPCLAEFSEKVLAYPAADRILVAVSDGLPEGRRSTASDLLSVVAKLSEPGVGLRLIGLGLGPHTEHVRSFYPEAVANVSPPNFAETIGALVERLFER